MLPPELVWKILDGLTPMSVASIARANQGLQQVVAADATYRRRAVGEIALFLARPSDFLAERGIDVFRVGVEVLGDAQFEALWADVKRDAFDRPHGLGAQPQDPARRAAIAAGLICGSRRGTAHRRDEVTVGLSQFQPLYCWFHATAFQYAVFAAKERNKFAADFLTGLAGSERADEPAIYQPMIRFMSASASTGSGDEDIALARAVPWSALPASREVFLKMPPSVRQQFEAIVGNIAAPIAPALRA